MHYCLVIFIYLYSGCLYQRLNLLSISSCPLNQEGRSEASQVPLKKAEEQSENFPFCFVLCFLEGRDQPTALKKPKCNCGPAGKASASQLQHPRCDPYLRPALYVWSLHFISLTPMGFPRDSSFLSQPRVIWIHGLIDPKLLCK